MPRFFFDVDDGALDVRDKVGNEFPHAQMACREAEGLLYALAKDAPGTLQEGKLLVMVRDAADVPVCTVQLTLQIEWLSKGQRERRCPPALSVRRSAGVGAYRIFKRA